MGDEKIYTEYKKYLQRIEALSNILNIMLNMSGGVKHKVSICLSQHTKEKQQSVIEILNDMAIKGVIFLNTPNGPYNGRLDLSNYANFTFEIDKNSYKMPLFVANEICNEKNLLRLIYQKEEQQINEIILNWNGEKEKILKIEEKTKEKIKEIPDVVTNTIDRELTREGRIGISLENTQKDIIQYMGIFVALFSLININIQSFSLKNIKLFIVMNVSLIASIIAMVGLLSGLIHKPHKVKRIDWYTVIMLISSMILWVMLYFIYKTI